MNAPNASLALAFVLGGATAIGAMHPSLAVQAFTSVACATTTACVLGTNTGSGPGVQGTSSLGKGVVGQTKFNSTTSSNGQSGIVGQDLSTSGVFDSGVTGTSVRGTGITAKSISGTGVSASSSSGTGMYATSGTGYGLKVSSAHYHGMVLVGTSGLEVGDFGHSSSYDDVFANGSGANLFRGNNSQGIDVFKVDDAGQTTMASAEAGTVTAGGANVNPAVYGEGYVGVVGISTSSTAPGVGVSGTSSSALNSTAIQALSNGGNEIIAGTSSNTNFYVDGSGNVHAHSFTNDLAASAKAGNGSVTSTYSPEVRTPTIEDYGEATLTAGNAYVRLDPSFADRQAHGTPYYVFITPLGPTRGSLYVSGRTDYGFYVRETAFGNSTVAFDYRIVGKRFMSGAARPVPHPVVVPARRTPSFERHLKQKVRSIPR